jgi:hypothetical protein
MKWLNHEIVTGTLVYGFTVGGLSSTLTAMVGGLFPDMIEGRRPKDGDKLRRWRAVHRGVSHWFLPYAVIAAIMVASPLFHPLEGASRHFLSVLGYSVLGVFSTSPKMPSGAMFLHLTHVKKLALNSSLWGRQWNTSFRFRSLSCSSWGCFFESGHSSRNPYCFGNKSCLRFLL